jgi:hypothetical protein
VHHPEVPVIGSIATTESQSDLLDSVVEKVKTWVHTMSNKAPKRLPEHPTYDHAMNLKAGKTLPWGPGYALSEKELGVLREWLKEMLKTGKIRWSQSPAAAPILFVPKAHSRGLRLCVDYHCSNKIKIANCYLLMSEL